VTEQPRWPLQLDGEFKFEVGPQDDNLTPGQPWWVVQLPHQCDEWVIAASKDRDEVIARVERFIAEAQGALAAFREMQ
jgi:hypothetical protein